MDVLKMAAGEARTRSRDQAWELVARKQKFRGYLSRPETRLDRSLASVTPACGNGRKQVDERPAGPHIPNLADKSG